MAQHALGRPGDDWPNGLVLQITPGSKAGQLVVQACTSTQIRHAQWCTAPPTESARSSILRGAKGANFHMQQGMQHLGTDPVL